MNDDQLLLTVPETAKLLRISRNLAYELVARGELPAVRFGRVIRVPRDALDNWVKASAIGNNNEDPHPN
jgi:excisionase family DNA binding protein